MNEDVVDDKLNSKSKIKCPNSGTKIWKMLK